MRRDVSSVELLDAIKCIHSMSTNSICDAFNIKISFHDRSSYIAYVIENMTPESIVQTIDDWKEAKVFMVNNVVRNYNTGEDYVVTYADDNKVCMLGLDGTAVSLSVKSAVNWFGRTNTVCRISDFLSKNLKVDSND